MSESVKVAVRCRPMNQRELQQNCRYAVTIDSVAKTCSLEAESAGGSGKVYQFDATFGIDSTTESVYEGVGSVIVEAVLEGYNGTVFAYGQTGCGKSFTMRGFIERTLEHLFEATSTSGSDTRYLALLSYLEIYNEKLRDLLQDAHPEGMLQLKEDPVKGTYVAGGLREVTVKGAAECQRLVEQGDKRRAAAATKMNAASSRSHAVMTLSLEAIAMDDAENNGNAVRRGRLHLVDLAGSERQGRTGATGDRLKEAASINLSLSALGNVISALAAGNGRHVPYRDSKLTRLLRDSLGGNARTLMIACVSPSDIDAEETLSTLRYAARARCIKNKPIVNEDPKDALLRQYQIELQRLRKLLEDNPQHEEDEEPSSRDGAQEGPRHTVDDEEVERLRKECESSNMSAQRLREELNMLRSKFENGLTSVANGLKITNGIKPNQEDFDPQREERRRKKREAAKQEVLKRLERLTIGGEARSDDEIRKRRERRRKRLEHLAEVLERSEQEGTGGAFEVYGQLKSTEEALKRMAKKAKQLEAEAADLQASWDAERRDLLRRELLATQLCEAMAPQLRPGCPFRDIAAVRAAATWSDELGRWKLIDATSTRIPLPPAAATLPLTINGSAKSDPNNNSGGSANGLDEESGSEDEKRGNIADVYFRRRRIDKLLAHVREAKTFDGGGRLSRSGGSEDLSYLPLTSSNLQNGTSSMSEGNFTNFKPYKIGGWLHEENSPDMIAPLKKNPPRILEALPSYPHTGNSAFPSRLPGHIT